MTFITKNDERIKAFFKALEELPERIAEVMKGNKPRLNGETYLTDMELSQVLKVSRRTLQEYRNQGKIPYIQLDGKILYRESDIQKMLEDNYFNGWQ